MKKLASVLISIILLVLINGLAHCAMPSSYSSDTTLYQLSTLESYEVVVEGYQFVPGGTLELGVYNIAGAKAINFYATSSSGNITTCNVEWQDFRENTKGSVTLTSGTDITDFKGNIAIYTFNNPVTITSNATINALITY